MTALTLADFLRARFDEDDQQAADEWPHDALAAPRYGTWHHWVLAGSVSKRRIVDLHAPFHVRTANDGLNWDYRGCGECSQPDGVADGETWWPCTTLRLLALPYASHPDYRQEWKP